MSHLDPLISDLALILAVAGITTLLFKRLKQPVVLGYVVAGFLCSGNFLLKGVSDMANVDLWAQIGIIFLLFSLGLEFSFKKLVNVGGPALLTALVIITGMMCTGFMAGKLLGWTSTDSVFLGGMLSMSSTTIIIKAFDDLGLRNQRFTSLVFGVLVVEDLFAVVLMVLFSTLFAQRAVADLSVSWQLFRFVFFLVLWFVVGIYLIPTFLKRIRRFLNAETLLVVSLALCLGMSSWRPTRGSRPPWALSSWGPFWPVRPRPRASRRSPLRSRTCSERSSSCRSACSSSLPCSCNTSVLFCS